MFIALSLSISLPAYWDIIIICNACVEKKQKQQKHRIDAFDYCINNIKM